MTIIINPYKNGSRGAKRLKTALTGLGVQTFCMQREPKDPKALIVNWGNSDWDYDPPKIDRVVNEPGQLKTMSNKLRFFQAVGHIKQVPEWTTEAAEAETWAGKGLARQKLEGSGGAGIVIWEHGNKVPRAPLYVKYENKTHEFRVHMARGLRSIDGFYPLLVQRKIFQKSVKMPVPKSWDVRNHTNGFVFVRESGYPTPDCVLQLAKDFMKEHFPLLHFCALDVIFNEKKNRAFVLEGNTAPGLEGNTIEVYADYFQTLAKEARAA